MMITFDFFVGVLYTCIGSLVTNFNRDEQNKYWRFFWDVFAAMCYICAGAKFCKM